MEPICQAYKLNINVTVRNETIKLPIKILGFIMSIVVMISSWFLNQAWGRIVEIEQVVKRLELSEAADSGHKFSKSDFNDARLDMDSERFAMDRRITRLEESIPVIKDSLLEIKETLKK